MVRLGEYRVALTFAAIAAVAAVAGIGVAVSYADRRRLAISARRDAVAP